MIENLKGIHETINYKGNSSLVLYDNRQTEDYPTHWHTAIEIIMPTENQYTVHLENTTIVLNAGDIIFLCPGVIHAIKAPETGHRIIFQADISTFLKMRDSESIISLLSPAATITPSDSPEIYQDVKDLLYEIYAEYQADQPLAEACIFAKLLNIFVLLGRNCTQNITRFEIGKQKQKEYTEKFIYICNYINLHCTEDISLDDIAELAGFSKYHFTRLFKQFTDNTFYKYLNKRRIEHAEQLLINSNLSITEVAFQSGFSSLSAFIRMFKLIKHCTPTDFRNIQG